MFPALIAAAALGAAWAGPLEDPARAPAWLVQIGITHDGRGWVYERRHPRRDALARRRLEPGELATLDAFLAGVPEAAREQALARPLLELLEERRMPAVDTVFFDSIEGELRLTTLGFQAVPGALLGDAFGDKFEWPPEEPETLFSKPIRLSLARLPEPSGEPGAGASRFFDGAGSARISLSANAYPHGAADQAALAGVALRLERALAPAPGPRTSAPAAAVKAPDQGEARERPGPAAPALTTREATEAFLSQITLPKAQPRWYTMDMTRSQWERWQSKAQAWEENAWLRWLYAEDIQRYYGRPAGREFAAMADVILTAFHQQHPNVVTKWLLWAARTYDDISREFPVQLGDELGDYLKRRWQGGVAGDLPSGIAQAAGLNTPDSGLDVPLFGDRLKTIWEELHPRLNLKVNPRFDLEEPSAKLGIGVRMNWRDWLRIRMSGAYDTRDGTWSGLGAIGADW